MVNYFFFLKIKQILIKNNFEMYLRAEKPDIFLVFHVENDNIQSMLWFYLSFNVELRVIWNKNKLFLSFRYVFY